MHQSHKTPCMNKFQYGSHSSILSGKSSLWSIEREKCYKKGAKFADIHQAKVCCDRTKRNYVKGATFEVVWVPFLPPFTPCFLAAKWQQPKEWSMRRILKEGAFNLFPSSMFFGPEFEVFSSEKLLLVKIGTSFWKWLSSANRETVAKFKIQLFLRLAHKLEWRENRKWFRSDNYFLFNYEKDLS